MEEKNYILQWNLNGIKARMKVGELQRLIRNYNPICICLQHLGEYNVNIQNYKLISQSIKTTTELGTAIYIRNNITADTIVTQNSEFQHSVTKIYINKNLKFTLCNVYNQPTFSYNFENLKNVLNTLPKPILLLGDLNADNPIWDETCPSPDASGKKWKS